MKVTGRSSNWIVALFIVFVFIAVSLFASLEKALASAVTFGVFAAIVQTKWESRSDWRFWAILTVFAIIHAITIALVNIPHLKAGLISLPFALVDGFVMWGLINWIEKHFPRHIAR